MCGFGHGIAWWITNTKKVDKRAFSKFLLIEKKVVQKKPRQTHAIFFWIVTPGLRRRPGQAPLGLATRRPARLPTDVVFVRYC
jgi:hypothetical protein